MEINRRTKALLDFGKNHPDIFRKLNLLYRINPGGIFSDSEVRRVGLTDVELKILKDYGIFHRIERR